jgi:hypothetical protein
MMRYSANWPRFPLTRPQLSGGSERLGGIAAYVWLLVRWRLRCPKLSPQATRRSGVVPINRASSRCFGCSRPVRPRPVARTRGEQASSHLAARKARDGQGYADSRFATTAILTGTRIRARTHTVSNVREEAEMLLIGSRHRRMQPIKPEEVYAMKKNTVCLVSLSAPAAPYMGRRSSPRGLERLLLLFSLLGSLFSTDRGSDE